MTNYEINGDTKMGIGIRRGIDIATSSAVYFIALFTDFFHCQLPVMLLSVCVRIASVRNAPCPYQPRRPLHAVTRVMKHKANAVCSN